MRIDYESVEPIELEIYVFKKKYVELSRFVCRLGV